MKTSGLLALLVGGWLLAGAAARGAVPQEDPIRPPPEDFPTARRKAQPDAASAVFASYRKWQRVTSKPVTIAGEQSAGCGPGLASGAAAGTFNVYVNKLGRPSLTGGALQPFAEGAVIVKEKLSGRKGAKPDVLLAMVKREEGFSPAAGDWEFFVLKAADYPVVIERGRISQCQTCHEKARGQDWIFRSYLQRR